MPVRISKEFKFEAAHQLYNHRGKCRNPHGHSYRVIVEVEGPVNKIEGSTSEGMVLDYDKLKQWWKTIEPALDHCDLNETLGHTIGPTTAENIAVYLLANIKRHHQHAVAVTVCETASSTARAS